jgi:hypothetical protein
MPAQLRPQREVRVPLAEVVHEGLTHLAHTVQILGHSAIDADSQ